jgi:hypothetical protein
MTTLKARAEKLKGWLKHADGDETDLIEHALREAIEAAAQVAKQHLYTNGHTETYSDGIAQAIRRELLS